MLERRDGQWFGNSCEKQEGYNHTFRSSGIRNVKEKVVNTLEACRENCVLKGELGFS